MSAEFTVPNAENLTLLELVKLLADHESKSMTIQLEGAPMVVRITLEFPWSIP